MKTSSNFYRQHDIICEYTTPNSTEENGIGERMNRTIQERVVVMLQHSGLSDGFWAEALLTAVHIINMSPSRPLGLQIPKELWTARNFKQDPGNAFSLAMHQTARSDTDLESRAQTNRPKFERSVQRIGYAQDGRKAY